MKTTFWGLCAVCLASGCASGDEINSVRGVLTDATMNTVTIATAENDTLSFSTMNANKENAGGLLLDDTLEVVFKGAYRPGIEADKLALFPKIRLVGGDRDEHGCIGSAGYTWSEVLQDCIRLFENGIRLEATDGGRRSAYVVFSPDSSRVELFFSDGAPNEILQRRRLTSGEYVWNVEDDDTKNLRLVDEVWTVSQRNQIVFKATSKGASDGLGEMQQYTYQGLLPSASGSGIVYSLTVSSRKNSGDGTFLLVLTYKEAENGQDKSVSYQGRRFTQRGMPGNNDATVWQCVTDGGKEIFNFLRENETTLTLLNNDFEKPQSSLNYSLKRVD